MVSYIFITDQNNWSIIKEQQVMGISFGKKNIYDNVEINTKCVVYITRIASFGGIFEITSKSSIKKIHWKTGSYPFLLDLKPILIFKEPISIKPHLKNLAFIKNKTKWFGHVFHEHKIPDSDIEYLLNIKGI